MARKGSKLSKLKQAHGKDENSKLLEINEILGIKDEFRKFKDVEAYETHIKKLDTADLQAHAVEVSVFPTENRTTLIDRLSRKFIEKKAQTLNTSRPPQTGEQRYTKKQIKQIKELSYL